MTKSRIVAGIVFLACTLSGVGLSRELTMADVDALRCPFGNQPFRYYFLERTGERIRNSQFQLDPLLINLTPLPGDPVTVPNFYKAPAHPSAPNVAMLAICDVTPETFAVVAFRSEGGEVLTAENANFVAASDAIVKLTNGPGEAGAELMLEIPRGSGTGYLIRGQGTAAGRLGVTTLMNYELRGDGNRYITFHHVAVGALTLVTTPIEPDANQQCPIGDPVNPQYRIGSGLIETDACLLQGVGNSGIYLFRKARVTDANVAIAEPLRGQTFEVAAGADMIYTHSHHNWCDNFVIRNPATGAAYAVVLWPEKLRDYDWVPRRAGTWVKYGAGEWTLVVTGMGPAAGPGVPEPRDVLDPTATLSDATLDEFSMCYD